MDLKSIFNDKEKMEFLSRKAIYNSAWWFSHSSGKPVRAKGDYRRVEWNEILGEFILPLGKGGNSLVVSMAIKEMASIINSDLASVNCGSLDGYRECITGNVVNYAYNYYSDYPTFQDEGRLIIFGTHGIKVIEFVQVTINSLRNDWRI